jgi:WD40 repeat protein
MQLATSDASGEIRLWSLESDSRDPVRILDGGGLKSLVFDSSGDRLAAFGNSGDRPTVRLWNLKGSVDADPTILRYGGVGPIPLGFLNGAAFDPSGRWLVTANCYSAALWPVGDRLPFTLLGHEGRVDSVEFTPDGKQLVSAAGGDGTVRVWSLESGASSRIIFEGNMQFPRLAMDPDGKFVVFPAGSTVFVVPLEGGTPRRLEGFSSKSTNLQVDLDPSGRFVAAMAAMSPKEEDVVRIWDLESSESWTLGPLESESGSRPTFIDGGRLLTDGWAAGLQLWSLKGGHLKTLSRTHGSTAASRDGRFVLREQKLSDNARQLTWFDIEKGVSKALSSFGNAPGRPAFDPSEKLALTAGPDGVVRVGPVTGEEPHLLFAHKGYVTWVDVSPDGRWIASAGFDGKIRLWPMPDTDELPFHVLPYEEFLDRLRAVTNVRVVEDESSSTGYRTDHAPFPGWEEMPEWW